MPALGGNLSQKMKNFCYAYLESCDAKQAYLSAYDTENEKVAKREGHALLKRDDIREFLAEINRPVANKIANEREKKRRILWDRIEICIRDGNEAAIARYMDILNRMDSEYVNVNRNIDDSIENLTKLSSDQLKEILDTSTDSDADTEE